MGVNLQTLKIEVLESRAKKLYFDKNAKIEKIFVDQYGRFSYDLGFLVAQNKPEVEIYEINRKGAVEKNTVLDLSEPKNVKAVQDELEAKAEAKKSGKKVAKKAEVDTKGMNTKQVIAFIESEGLEVETDGRELKDIKADVEALLNK